jgi:hypothetical protein
MTKAIDEVNIHLLFGLRVVVCLHPVLQVIKIRECDIYSYNPDSDGDPVLEKGAMYVHLN